MLDIRNLVVESDRKKILNGVSLKIKPGEIHALMGPNGSGKSSLALALAGHPRYQITGGSVKLDGKDITSLTPDKRAKLGLFLAMQYPTAIPGVSVANFLRTARKNLATAEAQNKKGDAEKITTGEFIRGLKEKMADLKIDEGFASRGINDGFSGGEKKKMEVLQLSILEPKYAILDETDSGLDIDALKLVASSVKRVASRNKNQNPRSKIQNPNAPGILLITHYQRILKYIKPDFVHVMVSGKIVQSGDHKLAAEIEKKGYDKLMVV